MSSRNLSEWGYGKSRDGIGWAVYRDGKEVDWKIYHGLCGWETKIAARWFAWREMIGLPSPRFAPRGAYRVVARGNLR